MKKYIATIGILVLMSGCASLDLKRSADANATASTQKIGMVSVLGDTFTGTSIGTTVLTNSEFLGNVPVCLREHQADRKISGRTARKKWPEQRRFA